MKKTQQESLKKPPTSGMCRWKEAVHLEEHLGFFWISIYRWRRSIWTSIAGRWD
jgi:hypothetical protein